MTGGFLEAVLGNGLVRTAGWVLAHSLWQAGLVALGLAVSLRLLPQRHTGLRAAATLGALLVVPLLVAATGTALVRDWGAHARCWDHAAHHASAECRSHGVPAAEAETVARVGPTAGIGPTAGVGPTTEIGPTTAVESTANASSKVAAVLPWSPTSLRLPEWMARPLALSLTPMAAVAALLWAAGVLMGILSLLLGLVRLRRVLATGRPVLNRRVLRTLRTLSNELDHRRPLTIRESADVDTPCVAGVLRPVILLPRGLVRSMGEIDLRATLAHELAHVVRRDYAIGLLVAGVRTLLCFNPFLRWISSRVRDESEAACDRIATEIGARSPDRYARTLLLLEGLRRSLPGIGPVPALVGEGDLLRRIRRIRENRVGGVADRTGEEWRVRGRFLAAAAVWAGTALLLFSLALPLLSLGSWAVMQEDLERRERDEVAEATAR